MTTIRVIQDDLNHRFLLVSSKAGLGRETLKSNVLTLAEEQQMLMSKEASPETAVGLTY